MCDVVAQAVAAGVSRRQLLARAGLTAGALAGVGLTSAPTALADPPDEEAGRASRNARGHRTRLVLLGTAGGPVWWPDSDRSGISSAIAVGDRVYLVDCGEGVGSRYRQSDLASGPQVQTLKQLRGIFLTHLHSDHTIDYPNLSVLGINSGLQQQTEPVQVYGPGNRGKLPQVFGNRPAPPVISPDDPTPGTEAMTEYFYKAWATDLNDRVRDGGAPDPRTKMSVHDIPLPAGVDADQHPPMSVAPFPVFEDDAVKVTATLVDHGQVFPSLAFRFDTDDGSVVFSGDTAPSNNLVQLAQHADVLVHEVIDPDWVRSLFGPPPFTPQIQAIVTHLLTAHTTIDDVGPLAERANVGTLVLNHFVPGNNPRRRWRDARAGFSGRFIVGEDLMQLGIGRRVRPGAG